jgi:hypothetical protein
VTPGTSLVSCLPETTPTASAARSLRRIKPKDLQAMLEVTASSHRTIATLLRLACTCALVSLAACSYGGGSSSGGGASSEAAPAVEEEPLQVARLVWSPAGGPVAAYDISVSRNGGAYELEQTALTRVFEVEGRTGERFSLRVRAVDAAGNRGPDSEPSAEIIFTEDGPALAQASSESTAPIAETRSLAEPASDEGGAAVAAADASPEVGGDASTTRGDVNGDGAADLLWVSPAGVMATRLDGDALATLSEAGAPNGWDIAGFGDFDGDASVDLLWTGNDGALAYSTVSDAASGLVALGVLEADETVVAVGDFDGNGVSDLVVHASDAGAHAWWKLDPNAGPTIRELDQPGEGSALAATGDFDGDDTDDLLWRASDGSVHVDFLVEGRVDDILVVSNGGDAALAAADFDGDGIDDILVRDTGGALAVWSMSDRAAPMVGTAPVDAGADWTVASAADYDGNGIADVLWSQGESLVLRLDGDPVDLPIDAGSDWALIPVGL